MWVAYKYTRAAVGHGKRPFEHVRAMLEDGLIYLPSPRVFWKDDPHECRPRVAVPTDEEVRAYIRATALQRLAGLNPSEQERQLSVTTQQLRDPGFLRQKLDRRADEYGILSLANSWDNERVWSRYALEGAGVCVGFDFSRVIDEGNVDWCPAPVKYVNSPATISLTHLTPGASETTVSEFVQRSFYTKTRQWEREGEIRVTMKTSGDRMNRIPDGVVTSLIFGPRIAAVHREQILAWCENLPVFTTQSSSGGLVRRRI